MGRGHCRGMSRRKQYRIQLPPAAEAVSCPLSERAMLRALAVGEGQKVTGGPGEQAVPCGAGNQASGTGVERNRPRRAVWLLEDDVDGTVEHVEDLVAARVHLPMADVAAHGKAGDQPAILDGNAGDARRPVFAARQLLPEGRRERNRQRTAATVQMQIGRLQVQDAFVLGADRQALTIDGDIRRRIDGIGEIEDVDGAAARQCPQHQFRGSVLGEDRRRRAAEAAQVRG